MMVTESRLVTYIINGKKTRKIKILIKECRLISEILFIICPKILEHFHKLIISNFRIVPHTFDNLINERLR